LEINVSIAMNDEQVQVLNFAAKLVTRNLDDLRRKFVVSFYLFDQTLQIYEELVMNSGFRHGKYLQKTRIVNPATRKFFAPGDFHVGAKINVAGRVFELLAASQLAYGIMEASPDDFPEADLGLQLSRLKTAVQNRGADLGQLLDQAANECPDKRLTINRAQQVLERFAPDVTKHAAATIARGYERRGAFAADEFLNVLKL
jgi:hypothetical protein